MAQLNFIRTGPHSFRPAKEGEDVIPVFVMGGSSHEGHVCDPIMISDINQIVPGRAWASAKNAEDMIRLLNAAFAAGQQWKK